MQTAKPSMAALRSTQLQIEYKEQSEALARACIAQALLELSHDPLYTGDVEISVTEDRSCHIGPITHASDSDRYMFATHASVKNTYSVFQAEVRENDLQPLSIFQVPRE